MPTVSAGTFRPIYDPSTQDEEWYINDHSIILDQDGLWHMFGITHSEPAAPTDERHLAHATSPRLTDAAWQKHPFAMSAEEDPWAERHLWAPHVILHEGLYYMYYCAGGEKGLDDPNFKIHLATSKDLWSWTRHSANPLLIDGYHARDPMVMRLGPAEWVMYYTATSAPLGGNHTVACVTSSDLISWKDKRTVLTHSATGTYGGPCESPFVVRRGGKFYLFAGPTPKPAYIGTEVFCSDSPFHWGLDSVVGTIPSHAAEVVRDVDGDWYVTHCGWGQKGLHIAPLVWNDGLDQADTSMAIH